jgi:molybdopterin-guanine dinucleotide biosynthesis protein A
MIFIERRILINYHNDMVCKDKYSMQENRYRSICDMDALILAGGENTRIPVPKGLLVINGERIIDRNVHLFKGIFKRIFISTNAPDLYFSTGAIIVGDIIQKKGPMTGICSALAVPSVSAVFVTACDMPFINVILVQYLLERWECRRDALIPIYRKMPEPLFGIYSKSIAGVMEDSIRKGERSLQAFLGKINVLYVDEEEVRRRDPEGKSFVNINTLEDYQKETGGKACLD